MSVVNGVQRVGKYHILRELGRGGMGVVYLAEDTRLQRQVALKVLHPALTLDTDFVARFASEARAIAALTHPGIVRVHAFEEVEGSHLIDMEYIDGRSLDQVLARGPVAQKDALNIMLRALEALAVCHARSMVHRDIKPSNILIGYDGRVLLSDFGLAMSFALASTSGATSSCFIGTPKYAPPESWDRVPPSPAGDVYSAGLVLLELLAGKTPFDGDSPLEIMRKSVEAPVIPVRDLLPGASGELVGLLESMLERDPANRPADARVALRSLRDTLEFADLPDDGADTIRITPPILSPIPERTRRMTPRRMIFPILMLVGIALLAALYFRPQRDPEPVQSADGAVPTPPVAPFVSPDVAHITPVGDYAVFTASAGSWRSVWSYNKSTGETAPLWPSLSLGPKDDVYGAYPVKQGIVAAVRTESNGIHLFRTDGTPEGTLVLAYAVSAQANRLEVLGGGGAKTYFNRIGGDGTFGLWETDGTIAGTRHLWGDKTTPEVSHVRVAPSGGLYFSSKTNGTLFYWPEGGDAPFSIWPETERPTGFDQMFPLDGRVLARADGYDEDGFELWIGDPKPGSLRKLRTIMPGSGDGIVNPQFASYGDSVVFAAQSPEFGNELWRTDGTEAGTCLVLDINPGAASSNPYRFTESGGLLYFSALTAEEGQELWVSDGTPEGTRMLLDIRPGLESGDPYAFCAFRDGLLFTPHDPVAGEELWFTDGTPEGTALLFDCMPGPESGSPHGTILLGDRAVFGANHPEYGRVLWETDGTPGGTRPLLKALQGEPGPPPPAANWAYFQDRVYMVYSTAETGAELWVTNPATGEAELLRDIYPGPKGSHPHNFLPFEEHLYFAAEDGLHGIELWRTDGTRDGTTLFYDSCLGMESGDPIDIIRWGNGSFAFSAKGSHGRGHGIFYFDFRSRSIQIAGGSDERGPFWKPAALFAFSTPEEDLNGDGFIGFEGWIHFSTQNAAGHTTLWRTNGYKTERIPALGLGGPP